MPLCQKQIKGKVKLYLQTIQLSIINGFRGLLFNVNKRNNHLFFLGLNALPVKENKDFKHD